MTSPKSVTKCRQQLHTRDVRGLVTFCFCPLEDKVVNQLCFPSIFQMQILFIPISRPDKHAELLKTYFKPLLNKLEFSTFVAKFNLRFKFNKSGGKIIHHEQVYVGYVNLTLGV